MSEINRILDQMDRAYSGEAWHGPDLKQLLDGVSAEDASKHPVAGAHSIWELVNHIAAWNTIVHQKSIGKPPRGDPGNRLAASLGSERQLPGSARWKILRESRTRLRNYVKTLRDDQLDEPTVRENYSRYVLLHGLVQHDLYHAGQIAVLKKALK